MKNRVWKRVLCLVAVCTIAAGCLFGCGGNGSGNASGKDELTFWTAFSSTVITNKGEMEMIQLMEERANVDITFSHPAAGTEEEQFNLKISGNNWEDMVAYAWTKYPGGTTQAITDGIIVDIAPHLNEWAPNFAAYLEAHPNIKKQIINEEGQIYGFPCIGTGSASVTAGFAVRQDWLDELEMDAPVTIADWEEMLTAFKDELGVDKPLTLQKEHFITANYFAGAYGVAFDFYLEDGVVKYGFIEDGMKDFLALMNSWYKKGLLDNESFGNDAKNVNSNMLNDISGATFGFVASRIGTIMGSAETKNPDMDLVGVQYPVLSENDEPLYLRRTDEVRANGMVCITTACDNVEAAMRYLDQFYSEEGIITKNFGVEGLTYEMVDGEPVYTDLIMNNPDGLSISDALTRYTESNTPSVGIIDERYYYQYYTREQELDAFVLWNEYSDGKCVDFLYPSGASTTAEESEELATIISPITTYVQEEMSKFITGKRSLDEWDDFVAQIESWNISRAIEIKQAAYDRYKAK